MAQADRSNGWEAVAREFARGRSAIGAATVSAWVGTLPPGACVLDLGCGSGVPISEVLIGAGCDVYGIDASPTLVAAFHDRFPLAQVACEPAEESSFFGRTYDGVVAVGLLFLLKEDVQRALIDKVAAVTKPGGRFLFTAPLQKVAWRDLTTGRQSVSLGDEEYRRSLGQAGFSVIGEYTDEGGNHYHDVLRN